MPNMLALQQFVANWSNTQLKESASYATHFDDLCELVRNPKPAHFDKNGEVFTYQTGVAEAPMVCMAMGAGCALENYAILRRIISGL